MPELARRPALVACSALVGLALLIYGFLLAPGFAPYGPYSDAIAYVLAAKQELHRAWSLHHTVPFWQTHQLAGGPALTNPQSAYFHPLHLLFWFLPPAHALGPSLLLCVVVASLVFYALGRTLGLEPRAATLMGLAGMCSGKLLLAVYAGWLPLLPSIVLSPLLVLCVVRLARAPTLGAACAFALAAFVCLSAGHIQIVYYTSVGCCVYLGARCVTWWRAGQRDHLLRVAAMAALGSLLAVGLTAYLLLPIAAELPLISRSGAGYEFYLAGRGGSALSLLTLFSPELLGTPLDGTYPAIELWEDSAYFGLLPLLFAGVAVLASPRRELVRPLAGAFVFSLALAVDTPLLRAVWTVLPGMHMFHVPPRILFVTSFLGITLAGLGIEAVLLRLRTPRTQRLLVAAVAVAMLGEASFYARAYLQMQPIETVVPDTQYAALLRRDPEWFRVASVGRSTSNSGWAAHQGLQLVTGYEPYSFRHYAVYWDLVVHGVAAPESPRAWFDLEHIARPDLLDGLDVKYLLSPVELRFPDERFRRVASFAQQPRFTFYEGLGNGPVHVYRRTASVARAFWSDAVLGVADERAMLQVMQTRPLERIAVAQQPVVGPAASPAAAGDVVRLQAAGPGVLGLRLTNAQRRFLVISELWHPGWQARLDGNALALARTNYALLGAWIPAGEHTLELRFEPLHWQLGRNLSLASAVMLLALALWARRSGRRSAGTPALRQEE
jgi:hypothetical protein